MACQLPLPRRRPLTWDTWMMARRFTSKDLEAGGRAGGPRSGTGAAAAGGSAAPHPAGLTHVSIASLVISRKGCNIATPALFTSRSTGPTLPSARSVASQSARSTHTGSTPGH